MEVMLGTMPTDNANYLQSENGYQDMRGRVPKEVDTESEPPDADPSPTFCCREGIRTPEAKPKPDDQAVNSAPDGFAEGDENAEQGMNDENASTLCVKEEREAKPELDGWYDCCALPLSDEEEWMKAEPEPFDGNVNTFPAPCSVGAKGNPARRAYDSLFNAALDLRKREEEKDEATSASRKSVIVNPTPTQYEPSEMSSPQGASQERSYHADVSPSYNLLGTSEREHWFRDAMSILHGSQPSDCRAESLACGDASANSEHDTGDFLRQNDDSVRMVDTSATEVTDTSVAEVTDSASEGDVMSAEKSLNSWNTDEPSDPASPTTVEPVEDPREPSPAMSSKLTESQLLEVWELAKKLYEARVAYNQSACRKLVPPEKNRERCRRRFATGCGRGRPGRTCNVGKGQNWKDPPPWEWGDPIPDEILAVLPPNQSLETKGSEPPAVICLSDDEAVPGSSTKESRPETARESVTKKGGWKTSITISDSEDEFPDVSDVLRPPGLVETKPQVEPQPQPRPVDSAEPADVIPCLNAMFPECLLNVGTSLTMRVDSQVQQIPLTFRERKRRRLIPSIIDSKKDVIVLGSSDESDIEVELVQIARKRHEQPRVNAPAPPSTVSEPAAAPTSVSKPVAPPSSVSKPAAQPSSDSESKSSWSCPICLEAKDNVQSVMSTTCGHVFCGPCIQSTIKINKHCPTCRRKLTARQIHKLFI